MAAVTAPVPSMAIALQTPARAPAMSAKSTKKQDLHAAGRRRLEQFKKNKREKAASNAKQTSDAFAEEQAPDPATKIDSNGDIYSTEIPQEIPQASTQEHRIDLPLSIENEDLRYKSAFSDHVEKVLPVANSIEGQEGATPFLLAGRLKPPRSHSSDSLFRPSEAANGDASVRSTSVPGFDNNEPARFAKDRDESARLTKDGPLPFSFLEDDSTRFAKDRDETARVTKDRQIPSSFPIDESSRLKKDRPMASSFPMDEPSRLTKDRDDPARLTKGRPVPSSFPIDEPRLISSRKDDFSALEQHIEDLTQEKFSLQRGLEKAKALVETLTQNNNALTEDYNQQGAKVNELKDELTRYQLEFRSQEIVLQNLKAERDRAVHEGNAATERARGFAAEIIALEEKVLKTRSQELKSQKEVESLREDVENYRKQILSLEKDRYNAVSLNEALLEEKKVLLSRIREAADKTDHHVPKEDVSTSTDDLVAVQESETMEVDRESVSQSVLAYPASIPDDQLQIIESINTLVTELGQEKDELLRSLRNESNAVAQLKVENAELLQKLERQTQQLELAVQQSMARSSQSMSPSAFHQNSEEVEYIDEGDEVVDRVLGWIMRLFPGSGSSRRKHL